MKTTKIQIQKGGDLVMQQQGNGTRLGRPPKEDRGEIIRNNGFSEKQWEWLSKEAESKNMDTMTYVRTYPVQWWIDSLEASRSGPVATPEDDEQFNKLVSKKSNHNQKKSKRSK
jgi:hypothetical protein